MTGKLVLKNSGNQTLNTSSLNKGNYIIKATLTTDKIISKKLLNYP